MGDRWGYGLVGVGLLGYLIGGGVEGKISGLLFLLFLILFGEMGV